jgi:hypothetical protein
MSISSTFYVQVFRQYTFAKKSQNWSVITEKLQNLLLYKNALIKCWWNWPLLHVFISTVILWLQYYNSQVNFLVIRLVNNTLRISSQTVRIFNRFITVSHLEKTVKSPLDLKIKKYHNFYHSSNDERIKTNNLMRI